MDAKVENCRKRHKKLRDAMTAEEVRRESGKINGRLLASDWYRTAEEIFAYYPFGNEADCLPFLAAALSDGKKIALPRTRGDGSMDFYRIESLTCVCEGRFHIMEPTAECERTEPDRQIALVPGTVFSRDGSRCGYGRGYYDRFFAKYPRLRRFGLCYENQLESEILTARHDVPMHRVYAGGEEIICSK